MKNGFTIVYLKHMAPARLNFQAINDTKVCN